MYYLDRYWSCKHQAYDETEYQDEDGCWDRFPHYNCAHPDRGELAICLLFVTDESCQDCPYWEKD